jgi:ankyrin repeat protein
LVERVPNETPPLRDLPADASGSTEHAGKAETKEPEKCPLCKDPARIWWYQTCPTCGKPIPKTDRPDKKRASIHYGTHPSDAGTGLPRGSLNKILSLIEFKAKSFGIDRLLGRKRVILLGIAGLVIAVVLGFAGKSFLEKAFREGERDQCAKFEYAMDPRADYTVGELLARGFSPNCRNDKGKTPLHLAVGPIQSFYRGFVPAGHYEEIVRRLIVHGADVNARANNGDTPLHWAVSFDAENVMEILIDHGANVNARCNLGSTPLHSAAARSPQSTKLLLRRGADHGVRDRGGGTPLHWAHSVETAKLLIEHGADVNAANKRGSTPLLETFESSEAYPVDPRLVRLLLEKEAAVNVRNVDGQTPLSLAKSEEVRQLLRSYGARETK